MNIINVQTGDGFTSFRSRELSLLGYLAKPLGFLCTKHSIFLIYSKGNIQPTVQEFQVEQLQVREYKCTLPLEQSGYMRKIFDEYTLNMLKT